MLKKESDSLSTNSWEILMQTLANVESSSDSSSLSSSARGGFNKTISIFKGPQMINASGGSQKE